MEPDICLRVDSPRKDGTSVSATGAVFKEHVSGITLQVALEDEDASTIAGSLTSLHRDGAACRAEDRLASRTWRGSPRCMAFARSWLLQQRTAVSARRRIPRRGMYPNE